MGGKKACGQQIVGEAVRGAANEIRGGRCNHDHVRFTSKPDVVKRVTRPKNLGMNGSASDRLEGDRSDEFSRRAGHHHVYFSACLCKQTRQPH